MYRLCKPPNQNKDVFLDNLSKELTNLTVRYDGFILLGDFKLTLGSKNLNSFMKIFNLQNLVKTPTSFKGNNPCCTDLLLTNKKQFLKKFCTAEEILLESLTTNI